jgi:hypothetical protein
VSNQQKLIYIHGEKVIQSPVHGGLIPPHGGIGTLGSGPVHGSPNNIPFSENSQLNGTGITIALGADGYYTVTTDASGANHTIGSLTPLTGDLLLELVFPVSPVSIMFGWRANTAPTFSAAYNDADAREVLQTEGGGGGANWTGTWKQGVFSGNANPAGRNGNLFMERVGTNWNVRTGTDFASSASLYTLTAVDAAARYLAITNITNNANFKFRFRQHP